MKSVTLNITIPEKYQWIAQQPWGGWTLFANKPHIHQEEEGDLVLEYWVGEFGSDYELFDVDNDEIEKNPYWKRTLVQI